MGKRSAFARVERDYWRTIDRRAVAALLPHLAPRTRFVEPCAGDGTLLDQLVAAGHVCARAWDIEPQRIDIDQRDALTRLVSNIDCFITNPPWTREILHKLIVHLAMQHPTWLLFDTDWFHTQQAIPFQPILCKVVSVGRLRWIEGSRHDGKDNCCWYLFDARRLGPIEIVGRRAA